MTQKSSILLIQSIFICWVLLTGCSEQESGNGWQSAGEQTAAAGAEEGPTITLGDIDPDTPTRRLQIIRPLADHLAAELGWDPSRVRVRIGRTIDEMISMMQRGEVDLYLDSGYPTLLAKEATGAEIVLESLVNGARQYHTVIISTADGPVTSLDELKDQVIVFQERYSTSGYLVPAAMLIEHGLALQYVQGTSSRPPEGKVGFIFSGDEENTLAMLNDGSVYAGALSSQDYESLPPEIMASFRVLAVSESIPRKLVALRAGFDETLRGQVLAVFLAISDEDRQRLLEADSWNWEFSELDTNSIKGIGAMETMIQTTRHVVPE